MIKKSDPYFSYVVFHFVSDLPKETYYQLHAQFLVTFLVKDFIFWIYILDNIKKSYEK